MNPAAAHSPAADADTLPRRRCAVAVLIMALLITADLLGPQHPLALSAAQ